MSEIVTIIAERRIPLPSPPGASRDVIELTYAGAGMIPRSIFVDPDHDSEEERIRLIALDLKAAREHVPSTVQLP